LKTNRPPLARWPAIAGIVIGSLVVISIVWCIIGCMCCGYTCCKGCCSCCRSSGGGRKRSKHADEPPTYQNPHNGYQPSPAPPVYDAPKYAQFDTPNRGSKPSDDALPHMPSWENATTKKVEDTSAQDLEMNRLDPSTGQNVAAIGRPGRSGYHEVPSQPSSPRFQQNQGYRGTEPTNPYFNPAHEVDPATIGVASSGYDHNPSYQDHRPNQALYSRSQGSLPSQSSHSPHPFRQQQPHAAYSPTSSASPLPSFSAQDFDHRARAPGPLQAGRRPVENSWREV
jgi:hypothetical protein